ncbi:MAG: hypothetical protein PHV42_00555 [Candidatus Pacebacteria bacterium]|nr:hypothetical protein [Candidatus Paceibacterota bacterium]
MKPRVLSKVSFSITALFLLTGVLFGVIFYTIQVTYADPPFTPYAPGATLDPACAPGDPECTVATSTAAVWGGINGTLSDQGDLQQALDTKLSTTTAASTYADLSGSTFSGSVSASNLSGTNTGDLTLGSAFGLDLSGQILSLTSGYNIPLTASTTNWNNFFDDPSTVINAGTNLSWGPGNTLNATGGGGGGTWGSITGTLSDQTDLQAALNAKLSTTTAASSYLSLDQTTPQTVSGGAPIFSGGINVGNISGPNLFAIDDNGKATIGDPLGGHSVLDNNGRIDSYGSGYITSHALDNSSYSVLRDSGEVFGTSSNGTFDLIPGNELYIGGNSSNFSEINPGSINVRNGDGTEMDLQSGSTISTLSSTGSIVLSPTSGGVTISGAAGNGLNVDNIQSATGPGTGPVTFANSGNASTLAIDTNTSGIHDNKITGSNADGSRFVLNANDLTQETGLFLTDNAMYLQEFLLFNQAQLVSGGSLNLYANTSISLNPTSGGVTIAGVTNFGSLSNISIPSVVHKGDTYFNTDTNTQYISLDGSTWTAVSSGGSGLLLDQTSPQTFTGGAVTGTGLLNVTSGQLGLDNNSYLTTGSASSTYVPYSGANQDVDLGNNTLTIRNPNVLRFLDNPDIGLYANTIGAAQNISDNPNGTSRAVGFEHGYSFIGFNSPSGNSPLMLHTANTGTSYTQADLTSIYTDALGRTLTIPDPGADANFVMTEGDQTINGTKTFGGSISASNLSGTNTGDVTLGTPNGLSLSGQVLSLDVASTTGTGALSSTDWNTFNGKLDPNGDGSGLTNLNASNLTSGTVSRSLLPTAFADASTTGISTFTASDFNDDGSGLISLDYANGQQANGSQNGFLSSTDWNTFNGKQNALPNFTANGILFGDGTNVPVVNSNFTWDGTNFYVNGNVGIGVPSPSSKLDIASVTEQLRLEYDASDYSSFTVDSGGGLTVTGSGANSGNITASVFSATSATTPSTFHDVTLGTGVEGDAPAQFGIDANAWTIGYKSSDKSFRIASSTNLIDNVALTVIKGGFVGIGTTTPTQMLTVGGAGNPGNVRIGAGWLCIDDNDTCTGATTAGVIYSNGADVTGVDLAENYPTKDDSLEAGEIVSLDLGNSIFVSRADKSSSAPVLGIVSTNPGFKLGGFGNEKYANDKKVPVALSGRIPVKVNLQGGPISIGDRIALSSVPGIGMKAVPSDDSVGIALEPFSGSYSSGDDTILVFAENKSGALVSSSTITEALAGSAFSQLSDSIKSSFASLGILMTDTVSYFKNLAVEKITAIAGVFQSVETYDIRATQLCLSDVCITKTELQELLDKNGITPFTVSPTPTPISTTSPSPTPSTSGGEGGGSPTPTATPTPDAISATPTPAPTDTASPTPSPSSGPGSSPEVSDSPTPAPSPTETPVVDATPAPASPESSPEVSDSPTQDSAPASDTSSTPDSTPGTP